MDHLSSGTESDVGFDAHGADGAGGADDGPEPPAPSPHGSAAHSVPPAAAGVRIPASTLRSQGAHPLWERAAGRGGHLPNGDPINRRGGTAAADDRAQRYEPLSALALEMDGFRQNADGASTLFSESDRASVAARAKKASKASKTNRTTPKKKKATSNRRSNDDGVRGSLFGDDDDDDDSHESAYSGDDNNEDGNDEDNGDERNSPRRKQRSRKKHKEGGNDAADPLFASAAFGGAYARAESPSVDDASDASATASQRAREARRAAFPIKGVQCVGCTLVHQIAPVERFVRENMEKMAEEPLWKFAALTYLREVREPRKLEGVETPEWPWKDLRTHFLLHASDPRIARLSTCRQLQTMRFAVEQRLMRVENGEKEVDKQGCDLMLKIIKEESAQRTALASLAAPSTAGGARRAPASANVGDAR